MGQIVGTDVAKWPDVIQDRLGITLKAEEAEALAAPKSPFASSIFYGNKTSTMAILLGNYTKVTWTSGNHTSDHVLVSAVGPGAEQFGGLTQNTSYFDWILAHKEIQHSNPTMTFEKAKEFYDKKKADGERDEHADLA
jgi:alkaline phosphatase